MFFKRLLISTLILFASFGITFADYKEINCSTDPIFEANSCNQCFDGLNKDAWSKITLLRDDWINSTSTDLLLYKEEQAFPVMLNLNQEKVEISTNPSEDDFWEYTDEFSELYSEEQEWYILPVGEKVTWIESKLDSYYNIDKNTAPKGSNIAMLLYPIEYRQLSDDWNIELDSKQHLECVLFKSWEATKQVAAPTKKLPDTWAEHILLIVIALILGFWIMIFRKRKLNLR